MTELKPGVYNAKIKISATPSSSCDPTAGPCEKWLPGNYLLKTGKNPFLVISTDEMVDKCIYYTSACLTMQSFLYTSNN